MKTVSFDLSRELSEIAKEKGVKLPESYFYWWKDCQEAHSNLPDDFYLAHEENNPPDKIVSNAYSMDELLEWMPKSIRNNNYLRIEWDWINKIWCSKSLDCFDDLFIFTTDSSPADTLCKLAIWLIKEGHIT